MIVFYPGSQLNEFNNNSNSAGYTQEHLLRYKLEFTLLALTLIEAMKFPHVGFILSIRSVNSIDNPSHYLIQFCFLLG